MRVSWYVEVKCGTAPTGAPASGTAIRNRRARLNLLLAGLGLWAAMRRSPFSGCGAWVAGVGAREHLAVLLGLVRLDVGGALQARDLLLLPRQLGLVGFGVGGVVHARQRLGLRVLPGLEGLHVGGAAHAGELLRLGV